MDPVAEILGDSDPSDRDARLVSAEELAGWLNTTPTAVHAAARAGILEREGKRGKIYRLKPSVQAFALSKVETTKSESAKLAKTRRLKLEIEIAERQGQLVDAEAVTAEWASALAAVRAMMLAIPSRLGERMPHWTPHDMETLDGAIRAALTEASGADDGDR